MKFPILYALLPPHKKKVFFYKGHTILTSCRFSLISFSFTQQDISFMVNKLAQFMHCHIKTINCSKANLLIISSIPCITAFSIMDENISFYENVGSWILRINYEYCKILINYFYEMKIDQN